MPERRSRAAAATRGQNALRAWIYLTKCAKRMEGHINDRFAAAMATSLTRFDVLANLARVPGRATSTTELSRMLLASKGNITRLLDRMEDDGLVGRMPDPGDRRVTVVRMTRGGAALFARLAPEHQRWTDGVFRAFDDAELHQLVALLRKLRISLDQAQPQDPQALPLPTRSGGRGLG